MLLENLSTFITGGSSGIGLATARAFAAEGAAVAITGRDRNRLDEAAARVGPRCKAYVADAADDDAMASALEAAAQPRGGIDALFVNAGHYVSARLGEVTRAELDDQMRVVTNIFMTLQSASRHLRQGASIIIMGSVYATMGPPGAGAYGASKAAASAMARSMASELASRQIRVNVIVPGAVDTPGWAHSRMEASEQARQKAAIGERALSNRMITPEEVANAVVFLASPRSSGINAAELVVDGGTTGAFAGTPRFARGEP